MVAIANQMNWEVIGKPSQKKDIITKSAKPFIGCEVSSGKGKRIYLTSNLSIATARATIAHEIMHSVFATINGKSHAGNLPSDFIEEVLCDYGAARLLVDDTEITNRLLLPNSNLAERLIHFSSTFNVPINYVAFRLFDVLSKNNSSNITAIIEWYPSGKKQPAEEFTSLVNNQTSNIKLTPLWAVCKNIYIPRGCTAKQDGVIFKSFLNEAETKSSYTISSAMESVSIGPLKGEYHIHVCARGKTTLGTRFVTTVFIPVS